MMTGNTHPRISKDDVRNLRIPVPNKDIQKEIVAETHRRKTLARQLKQEAEQDWATAKAQFEKELLGE
jgi:restriction endonuclease S subunit